MGNRQALLSHHLDPVTVGQLVAQIPANVQDDDFIFEVSCLEQVALALKVTHAGQRSSLRSSRRFALEPWRSRVQVPTKTSRPTTLPRTGQAMIHAISWSLRRRYTILSEHSLQASHELSSMQKPVDVLNFDR